MSGIEGIIIRVYPSGEADLVLKVMTKDRGKLSLIAKHARKSRKRFGSGLDLFDRGIFEFRESRANLAAVSGFIPRTSYPRLRSDLDRLTAATVVCECFDILIRDEMFEAENYFEMVDLALKAIEDAVDLREMLRAVYAALVALLNVAGHLPDDFDGQPSAHGLKRLVQLLERASERELESKSFLLELVRRLRGGTPSAEEE